MQIFTLSVDELNDISIRAALKAGDKLLLSGIVYTARDAAHIKLFDLIENGRILPFDISGSVIYYAGPTPTKPNGQIGSFGPTTSSRMDKFAPKLYDMGMTASIGKGNRNNDVNSSVKRNKALYLCAGGGLGALISRSIKNVEVIAFEELGCESIKKLTVEFLPLTVATDIYGNSIFDR